MLPLILLFSCSPDTGMSLKTQLKMKKGMTEKAYNNLLENEKLLNEYNFDNVQGKKVKVKVFSKSDREIYSAFYVAFVDDMLYYWGFSYEFARHGDPLINDIGKNIIEKIGI